MTKLLLPLAHDSQGNLIHIDNAQKGDNYTCPICETSLILRVSKIPEGQKYHRRNHFAHKGYSDNHCSESFLHIHFKDKCAEFIREKINRKGNLFFWWQCKRCHHKQSINLLNNVADIDTEHRINKDKPIPDIALLDSTGKIIAVIEIVVTHKPESKVLQYYKENNILCLQTTISDFKDCENIENILTNSNKTILHSNTICEQCSKMGNRTENYVNLTYNNNPTIYHSGNDRLINFLKTKGDKICSQCGSELQIQETHYGELLLQCKNYPKCNFTRRISDYDHLIFPNISKNKN